MSKVNWVINRRCVEPYGGGVGMDHQKKFMDIPYCIQYGRGHSVLYTGSRGNSHEELARGFGFNFSRASFILAPRSRETLISQIYVQLKG